SQFTSPPQHGGSSLTDVKAEDIRQRRILWVAPPRRVDKKDANRKTRDFLGFSSFFALFLTFFKFRF
ncbi:MAG: hypothetical protein SOV18_03875, partial [Eubacteriales bacterium]|nr:hypothetical protein [Eubacteriales bacterium]